MDWLFENMESMVFVATSVISAASAIAALTPTPKDDGVISFLRRIVEFLALNVGNAKKN